MAGSRRTSRWSAIPSMISRSNATFLIDRAGKIPDSHVGMVNKDAFEKEIQILLKEPAK